MRIYINGLCVCVCAYVLLYINAREWTMDAALWDYVCKFARIYIILFLIKCVYILFWMHMYLCVMKRKGNLRMRCTFMCAYAYIMYVCKPVASGKGVNHGCGGIFVYIYEYGVRVHVCVNVYTYVYLCIEAEK